MLFGIHGWRPRTTLWRMNSRAIIAATALVVAARPSASMQAPPQTVDGLVSAAKAAAGLEWSGTFLRLCVPPPPPEPRAAGGRGGPAGAPPRTSWYAEPAKVADNFYFLGTKIHNAWALAGSDGIIVFEALFDYAAPDEIADGMTKGGARGNKVKYVLSCRTPTRTMTAVRAFCRTRCRTAKLVYGGPDWDAVGEVGESCRRQTETRYGRDRRDEALSRRRLGADCDDRGPHGRDAVVSVRGEGQRPAASRRVRRRHCDSVRRERRLLRTYLGSGRSWRRPPPTSARPRCCRIIPSSTTASTRRTPRPIASRARRIRSRSAATASAATSASWRIARRRPNCARRARHDSPS